ncbi:hypothetical protein DXT76_20275 [Halobacillus trueperi]|uniref:Uncharacterized protein n=1 Tax=Halobacillus trueperi TaxID=156205 RepID=A0A3D8VBW9_9BACI|nr:hypothetical protein [Halobacillus trueperi]RDY66934.1 hypothetical protein DXT76_20275 [Halobacillus trueperi]
MNHHYRDFSTQHADLHDQRIVPFLPFLLASPFFYGSGYCGFGGHGFGHGGFGHGGFREY